MRGQWWLPEAAGTDAWFESRRAQSASERRAASAASRGAESDELLVKARALRMNTEARRAIFCVVMGSEDFADALERLQKLPLADKQDREICRVLIECCLQERAYNPYYETLASKLCERFPKKHKLTLQLCAWDQMREVGFGEAGEHAGGFGGDPKDKGARVRRIANLARFVAGALLSGAMAPAALKACFGDDADEFASDFSDASASRRRLFRRLLLQALLSAPEGKRLGAARTVFQTVAERASGKGAPREARAIKEAMLRALERGGGAALREGLDAEGGEDEPGSAAYVAKRAREARNLLNGTLA
jgi:nucleolar MIF4G domain-containing protein 1